VSLDCGFFKRTEPILNNHNNNNIIMRCVIVETKGTQIDGHPKPCICFACGILDPKQNISRITSIYIHINKQEQLGRKSYYFLKKFIRWAPSYFKATVIFVVIPPRFIYTYIYLGDREYKEIKR
jgi:hypothetical protein